MSLYIPSVIENKGRGDLYMDVWTRLLKDRIIFVNTEINHATASAIIAQLLYLASESSSQEIKMYINSPGGSVTDGLMIYDTMQYITCDISTFCMGQAASMGAFLLAAGTKGKRYALPHSRIMMHQPWGGVQGTAQDITIHADEILKLKNELNRIMGQHLDKKPEQIEQDIDRDNFMSAQEAMDYGVIDEVLLPSDEG
jgi:ATP-dependent Clp protease, protease subunit